MEKPIIKVDHVGKVFKLPQEKQTSIKSMVVNFYRRKRKFHMQRALQNISFEVKKGEFFGIIGRNGSGKSTLLKILAGIYVPTSGSVDVNGSLTPFIELGVGFNQELTGRENVFLNGALLGFNRTEMKSMYKDIVDFAELEGFMDQKLKNYSSGMQVRLAFSIAIRAKSDILLIDEVLAVGDLAFQEKCYKYFEDVKRTGRTLIFVSHDSGAVERFCDRVIIIDKGKAVDIGRPLEMVLKYGALVAEDQMGRKAIEGRHQEAKVKGQLDIEDVLVINKAGETTASVNFGEPFTLRLVYKLKKPISNPLTIGIDIIDSQKQVSVLGPNTGEEKKYFTLSKSGHIDIAFNENPLAPKPYSITAGVFNKEETFAYDLAENIRQFKILGRGRHGEIYIKPSWTLVEEKTK